MSFKNKTILVTGGAGFIGSNMCDVLIREDVKKIIVFDNFCASPRSNVEHLLGDKRFELVAGDIRDFDVIRPYVLQSDFVFNLAASKLVVARERPRIDLETNIVGTFNILQAARENPAVRIVHASTGSVLGSSDQPMSENHHPNPTTLYGISKLSGEKYCQFFAKEFGVKVSIIRYFHVFGPRQDYQGTAGVINIFLSKILRGQAPTISGTGEQIRCFTFVLDDIGATLMLSQNDKTVGQIYNVASETRISIKDLADLLISRYAGDRNLKPLYTVANLGENLRPIPDTAKIEKLGFKASYTFERGLDITREWIEQDMIINQYAAKQ